MVKLDITTVFEAVVLGASPSTPAFGEWRSLIAYSLWKRVVAGLNPASPTCLGSSVVERLPEEQKVDGSIPSQGTCSLSQRLRFW